MRHEVTERSEIYVLRFEGKVAAITGGASGIGRACAERFALEGGSVVIGDINDELAAATAAAIESKGGTAHAVHLDAPSSPSNAELFRTALDKYGRLDAVVAAAGLSHASYVSGESASRGNEGLLDQSVEEWQRVLDVNLTGVMLADQQAAKVMIEAGNGGTIVNIASAAAKVPLRTAIDYSVSKAAVAMLTKAFALEAIEHGIRVNAVGPGFVETPMTAPGRESAEGLANMIGMTPMGRLGRPDEIADTVLFLSSEASSYISGQIIFPAGGMFVG